MPGAPRILGRPLRPGRGSAATTACRACLGTVVQVVDIATVVRFAGLGWRFVAQRLGVAVVRVSRSWPTRRLVRCRRGVCVGISWDVRAAGACAARRTGRAVGQSAGHPPSHPSAAGPPPASGLPASGCPPSGCPPSGLPPRGPRPPGPLGSGPLGSGPPPSAGGGMSGKVSSSRPVATFASSSASGPTIPAAFAARAIAFTRAFTATASWAGIRSTATVAVWSSFPYIASRALRSARSRRRSAAAGSILMIARRALSFSVPVVICPRRGDSSASTLAASSSDRNCVASASTFTRARSARPAASSPNATGSRPTRSAASSAWTSAAYPVTVSASAISSVASRDAATTGIARPGQPGSPGLSASASSRRVCARSARRSHFLGGRRRSSSAVTASSRPCARAATACQSVSAPTSSASLISPGSPAAPSTTATRSATESPPAGAGPSAPAGTPSSACSAASSPGVSSSSSQTSGSSKTSSPTVQACSISIGPRLRIGEIQPMNMISCSTLKYEL